MVLDKYRCCLAGETAIYRLIAPSVSLAVRLGQPKEGKPPAQYLTLTDLSGVSLPLTSREMDFSKLTGLVEAGVPRFFDLDLEVEPRSFRGETGSSLVLYVVRANTQPKERKVSIT